MVERTLQSAQLKISADSCWIRGGCTFAHDRRLDLADHEGLLVRPLRIALDD